MALMKKVIVFLVYVLSVVLCQTCHPIKISFSLYIGKTLQVLWETLENCEQVVKYKKASEQSYSTKPGQILDSPNNHHFKALIPYEGGKYSIVLGYNNVWTHEYFVVLPGLQYDASFPMLRIFIVSNLIPGDATSINIVKKIKERVSAHESPAMLVDLGAENSAYNKGSHEYYALLAPVIENVPYHPIRRKRDNAVESVDVVDIEGVKLLFPFIENYHPSDEQHHSEVQSVLSNALQNPNPHLNIVFQRDVFIGSNKDQEKALAGALEKLFVNAHISLVVSGGAKVYARKAESERDNSLPIYVTTGIGSSNFSFLKHSSGELITKYKPSFGELTINCSLSFSYQQRDTSGNIIDTFDYDIEGIDGSDAKHSNEKIIAIIVLGCSLAFLGYFIYSWVSCYLKKPRVVEREEVSTGIGENREGYVMQPMSVAPK